MKRSQHASPSPALSLGCFVFQTIALALCLLFILEEQVLANVFASDLLWSRILQALGGETQLVETGLQGTVPIGACLSAALAVVGIVTLIGAALQRRPEQIGWGEAIARQCVANVFWALPIAAWLAGWIINLFLPEAPLSRVLLLTSKIAVATTLSGWLWETVRWLLPPTAEKHSFENPASKNRGFILFGVLAGAAVYTVVMTAMNWGLWFNLLIPHGDSSMYEEHLWNVLHGKGFRSYLDQGLFLGEHIQVIHLLLIPLYVIWPSHLLLELSQSAVLAFGALPVAWIARRHSKSDLAALLAGCAYLLYFPMHYLDIAIDLKTFRPSAFGITALLFALDQMERRRWKGMAACMALALASQEDFAIAIAPIGLWLAIDGWRRNRVETNPQERQRIVVGLATSVIATGYLLFVLKVALPYFRDGVTIHYASYFQAFGETPLQIAWTMLTRPDLLAARLMNAGTLAALLLLLAPIGYPWRAWDRLLAGAPLFVLLCLNELAQSTPGPFHHFHAPLIPIVAWGACAALGAMSQSISNQRALWMLCCAFVTTVWFGMTPLSVAFWDPGHSKYWRTLYVKSDRAKAFDAIADLVPNTARVASTDFVHPRYIHADRSYDYSDYPRRVANYEPRVPDDTDWIVIDTRHPYSKVRSLDDVRELKTHPERWEVVAHDGGEYYIVLKRKPEPGTTP